MQSDTVVPISVVVIAKNAQQHLRKCLESVQAFAEVIVYVNDSSDRTEEIAAEYTNVRIINGYFDGFGNTKNRAASFAKHDWILTLDSDEVITDELSAELRGLEPVNGTVYKIYRVNHYGEKAIDGCGWGNDYVLRLYNSNYTSYSDAKVHEGIISDGLRVVSLQGALYHYPFKSIKELIKKADYYSTLYAESAVSSASVVKAVTHSQFMFFKSYILEKGILYGYEGFVISFFNAFGSALKYLKKVEVDRKNTGDSSSE